MAKLSPAKLKKLKQYFEKREDVAFAFLFGSYAKGTATKRSDADVGVYFKPAGRAIEWEEDRAYPQENEVWSAVGDILNEEIDLVVLNRVSVGLAYSVLTKGAVLAMNDKPLYWRFYLLITDAGPDFFQETDDFWRIKERSHSLTPDDRDRLRQAVDFLEDELTHFNEFRAMTQQTYVNPQHLHLKRSVERWVENIVNASRDIAKTILASEQTRIPQKFVAMLSNIGFINDFGAERATALGEFTKLRNILAHEYPDIRFAHIRKFIDEAEPLYRALADFARGFLDRAEKK